MNLRVLVERPDLLAQEATIVAGSRRTWAARLHDLNGYGTSGGSAADRRAIVEAMASLEAQASHRDGTLRASDRPDPIVGQPE